jgi:hypothetical protein
VLWLDLAGATGDVYGGRRNEAAVSH